MKKYLFLFICLISILAGCSKEDSQPAKDEIPELLEVSIKAPENADPNKEVVMKALVTQGKEKVEDADEVKFEIRKDGAEDSEMIHAKHEGKGVYSIKKTFKDTGTYIVIAHVTARSMHNMPKQEIKVGEAEAPVKKEQEHHHEEGHEHSQGNHHQGKVSIDFHTHEAVTVNQKAILSAHIKKEDQPLTDAAVRFEIWRDNEKNHEYVDAVEGSNGVYTLEKTFPSAGTYHLTVHVEKGEIHDHQENSVIVK